MIHNLLKTEAQCTNSIVDYSNLFRSDINLSYSAWDADHIYSESIHGLKNSLWKQIVRALEGDSSLEDSNEGAKQNQNGTFVSQGFGAESQAYNSGMYNADMSKFRKMIMNSQEYNSSEFGETSDYGLNPSSSSSDTNDSREYTQSTRSRT